MALCWPLVMSPTQKAVLISLADQANDQGFCWPSVASIALRTCLSERTVRKVIGELEKAEFVRIHERKGSSNYYTVTPAAGAALQGEDSTEIALAVASDHKATPARAAPLREPHPCESRTTPLHQMQGTPASAAGDPCSSRTHNRKEPSMNRKEPSDSGVDTDAKAAIDYLNEKIDSRFQATKQNCGHVRARIGEGNTLDDVKAVIDFKVQEWGKDAHMRQYLRPETLFGKKFPGYLVAARAATQTKRPGDLSGKNYREGVDEDGRPN
jgi:uncharacterized phage protein (TIGR02220 family)